MRNNIWQKGLIALLFSVSYSHAIITSTRPVTICQISSTTLSGCIALWHFSEGAGTIVKDENGGYNGELRGNPTWTAGKFGTCIDMDGTGDYIVLNSTITMPMPFTINFWAYPENTSAEADLFITSPYAAQCLQIVLGAGDVWHANLTEVGYSANAVALLNQWQMVTIQYISTALRKSYINGKLKGTNVVDAGASSLLLSYIGSRRGTQGFYNGKIDEVSAYSRQLSEAEIDYLYTNNSRSMTW